MTSPTPLNPAELTLTWETRFSQRWVRFHSLPDSRRYPRTEDEYTTVLMRHHTILSELATKSDVLVFTADWTETQAPGSPRSPRRPQHWRTLIEDQDEQIYTQVYVESLDLASPELGRLLRGVADDELGNVIIAPADLEWLYHPYDGGADVILPTPEQRDALKLAHRDWLSGHPAGP